MLIVHGSNGYMIGMKKNCLHKLNTTCIKFVIHLNYKCFSSCWYLCATLSRSIQIVTDVVDLRQSLSFYNQLAGIGQQYYMIKEESQNLLNSYYAKSSAKITWIKVQRLEKYSILKMAIYFIIKLLLHKELKSSSLCALSRNLNNWIFFTKTELMFYF